MKYHPGDALKDMPISDSLECSLCGKTFISKGETPFPPEKIISQALHYAQEHDRFDSGPQKLRANNRRQYPCQG